MKRMAMLTFIGLGLYDERDISVKGREAVAAADMVYAEFYTSRLMGTSLAGLEKFHGKKIHLPRWRWSLSGWSRLKRWMWLFWWAAMPWSPPPIWT
jgi:hypothetical protein